jgi:CubicO group peptidase (beta-lactamase class C family)
MTLFDTHRIANAASGRGVSRRAALKWGVGGLAAVAAGRSVVATRVGAAAAAQGVTADGVAAALPEVEKLAQQAVDAAGVPGLAIAVVYRNEIVYLKGLGVRATSASEQVDPDTVFQLASMSKPIAATVVAAIVGDGLASWDSRLSNLLPDFALSDPWVSREVTIRDCFCHRTGLPGSAGNDLEAVHFDREEILHRLRYLQPASSFRSHYAYSNFGLTAGGVAAARATGMSWEEVSAARLYQPLGMTATSSRFADYEAATNRALLHVLIDGRWEAAFTRDPDAQSPAGGVSSTARDLAQWVRVELSGGKLGNRQVIDADALAQTHEPQIVRGTNFVTGEPAYYGLGWNVDYDEQGRMFWGHAGAFSLGARTYVSLLPAENLGIVVLANAFPTGVPDGIAAAFYDLVLNNALSRDWIAFWNKPYDQLYQAFGASAAEYANRPTPAAPPLPAAAYLGAYANDYFGTITIVEENGGLTLRIGPEQEAQPLTHFDRDIFTHIPAPEPPAPPFGVTFSIAPDQTAHQVVLEVYDDAGQGTFTRVSSGG